jgi:hypothetical protein
MQNEERLSPLEIRNNREEHPAQLKNHRHRCKHKPDGHDVYVPFSHHQRQHYCKYSDDEGIQELD